MVTRRVASSTREQSWAPDRQEVIWINCNPQAGNEMRDIHPFLVLSPRVFNERTSLVIGLPMTTAQYNADNPFAVAVGLAKGKKAGKISYVLCHQPKSFDWRTRNGAPHPLKRLDDKLFVECCSRLNQIVQLAR
jgi:mRNA interferase MazF